MSRVNPVLGKIEEKYSRQDLPDFRVGDTLRVHAKIKEGNRERIQVFEGVCIRKRNRGISSTFTVRKMSYGIGVEKIFPVHSPVIDTIEIRMRGKVRRAKLYYLRQRRGRSARIKSKKY
ncbi:MAG: 50S ribosomal protein L19 [Deltaproteobacteria bacterium]|jgi:large subunit ribosomal protein L19|nr:50S ribosomal protein L19 [Deltaproteobacteria bacterium]